MLTFCNQYPSAVWLTIMWYTPNCIDGGDWTKKGWWYMETGQCVNTLDADLDEINSIFCYYAETADGNTVWAGPYVRNVPYESFEWCEFTASTESRDLGYRGLDIGDNDDYTLTLMP